MVFGDVVHVSPLLLALQFAGIAAMMVGGVILVARAPVFRGLHVAQLPHAALSSDCTIQQRSIRGMATATSSPRTVMRLTRTLSRGDEADARATTVSATQPTQRREEASPGSALGLGDGNRDLGDLVVVPAERGQPAWHMKPGQGSRPDCPRRGYDPKRRGAQAPGRAALEGRHGRQQFPFGRYLGWEALFSDELSEARPRARHAADKRHVR